MKIIRTYLHITCNKNIFLLKNILSYWGYSPTSQFFLFLSEHKHCDNAATNSNSENARSRMEASMLGSVGTGDKERRVKYWARLGCSISPCYGPFSLGARFENYQQFIPLVFPIFFFSGRGKPRITESADTGFRLYIWCAFFGVDNKRYFLNCLTEPCSQNSLH
jgi:hypothetical protein